MTEDFIYLDHNATTPVDPRVAAAMEPYLREGWGNPSSGHRAGREARAALERSREQVAACLGCAPGEVIFTSGGTESDNLAIRGVVGARGGGHVIASLVEHPAVLEVVLALEAEGRISLTLVPVDARGRVDPEAVRRALRPDTVLVTLMLANNEVGTLQPVAEVAALCREAGVLVHTDAAQALGKIPVNARELGVDLLTVAGHKLYAPKGVGALYVREGVRLEPVLRGAGQERGIRPGTENVLEIVGLGEACSLVEGEVGEEGPRLERLRDLLLALLRESFPDLVVHGHPELRLPNTLSVAIPGTVAARILERLSDSVGASAGAACHGSRVGVSHVMAAMGVSTEVALATLRLSVGRFTTASDVEEGARRIAAAARSVRKEPGRGAGMVPFPG